MTPRPNTVEDIPYQIRSHMAHMEATGENLPSALLSLLGCPHKSGLGTWGNLIATVPVGDVDVRSAALLTISAYVASDMLDPVCPVASVLAALARDEVWHRCLHNESTAYDLAAVTLSYVEGFSRFYPLDGYAEPGVRAFLNQWLMPPSEWIALPSAVEVAGYLFGPAWCDLRLPDPSKSIGRIVYLERPPFQSGICPVQKMAAGRQLPDLGSPE
jgi:hypothetical protein